MTLRTFRVLIGPRNAPRLAFEAMAVDSMTCFEQHMALALPGERFEVIAR